MSLKQKDNMSIPKFDEARLKKYQNAGYKVVGNNKHSGIEVCRWTKSKLKDGKNCYKQWYGIDSSRCMQVTPTLDNCTFSCTFCWRTFGPERNKSSAKWDSPKELLDLWLISQRKLLSGFGGNNKVTKSSMNKSLDPIHVTLSLDGEPTLYPKLAELIKEIKSRGMTLFLVTNGTNPARLKELLKKNAIPNNLTISVYDTNPEDYIKITNSFMKHPMERVLESLSLFKSFDKKNARTIFKMTLVKGLNMKDAEGYSSLINKYQPRFIHVKGYSWLGSSKQRLKLSNMPTMKEIEEFAELIRKNTNYIIQEKDDIHRVVLLIRDKETIKWNLDRIKEQNLMIKLHHQI